MPSLNHEQYGLYSHAKRHIFLRVKVGLNHLIELFGFLKHFESSILKFRQLLQWGVYFFLFLIGLGDFLYGFQATYEKDERTGGYHICDKVSFLLELLPYVFSMKCNGLLQIFHAPIIDRKNEWDRYLNSDFLPISNKFLFSELVPRISQWLFDPFINGIEYALDLQEGVSR